MKKFSVGISLTTIAEVNKGFLAYHNDMFRTTIRLDEIRSPHFWELYYSGRGQLLAERWHDFYRLYFDGMTHPVPDAPEAIPFLLRRYEDVCIFVDCHNQHVDIIRDWIMAHFNGWRPTLCFTRYHDVVVPMPHLSAAYGIDGHVEDNPESAEGIAYMAGGVILPTRPWNEDYELEIVERVLDWDEITDAIEAIKRSQAA